MQTIVALTGAPLGVPAPRRPSRPDVKATVAAKLALKEMSRSASARQRRVRGLEAGRRGRGGGGRLGQDVADQPTQNNGYTHCEG
jgi:hypothetical protein